MVVGRDGMDVDGASRFCPRPGGMFQQREVSGVEESVVEILERSTQSLSVLLLHTALNEAFHQNDSLPLPLFL